MTVKELYDIIHCDYQAALNIMMNDTFITRMLGKFIQSNSASGLFESYEKKDYQGVFAAAHSLKGVAGNLGLTAIFNKIVPIVEATRKADEVTNIDKEMIDFKKEYEFVISKIKEFLGL